MKRIWIGLLLCAAAAAQAVEVKTDAKPEVQRLFVIKYADPQQIGNLVRVFASSVTVNDGMRVLAVKASPEAITAIEDAIKRLDVPSAGKRTDVDLTAYLIIASDGATPVGSPLPSDLESVGRELKNAFPFKGYGVLDVITCRTRSGQSLDSSSTGGALVMGTRAVPVTNNLHINSVNVEPDGATIRIDKMRSSYRVPMSTGSDNQFSYQELGINTDLDIKEGQKVVVGRVGINQGQALFLVLSAKII